MISISKDIENKTLHVVRQFNAPLQKVWSAWTESDILDKWWAPRPWNAKAKIMEFKNGGRWLYAMVGPEDEYHWSICTYEGIDVPNSFKWICNFCDENGKSLIDSHTMYWLVEFSEKDASTTVNVTLSFDDKVDMEKIIQMGFEGGFTIGLNQLEALLS